MVMLLLGFLLLIAVSLTLWAALTLLDPPRSVASAPRAGTTAGVERSRIPESVARPSNDEIRGARATVAPRSGGNEDAFERFLRADRDKRDF